MGRMLAKGPPAEAQGKKMAEMMGWRTPKRAEGSGDPIPAYKLCVTLPCPHPPATPLSVKFVLLHVYDVPEIPGPWVWLIMLLIKLALLCIQISSLNPQSKAILFSQMGKLRPREVKGLGNNFQREKRRSSPSPKGQAGPGTSQNRQAWRMWHAGGLVPLWEGQSPTGS